MVSKPVPWIAVALSLFSPVISLLYVRRAVLACVFAAVTIALTLAGFVSGGKVAIVATMLSLLLWIAGIGMSYSYAKAARPGARPGYAHPYALAAIVLVFLFAVFGVRVFLYETFSVPSGAMRPTLEPGSRILVQKYGYGHLSTFGINFGRLAPTAILRRGDIVVFDYPKDPTQAYMKRLVGLPGDTLVMRDKELFVNGTATRGPRLPDYPDPDGAHDLQRHSNRFDDLQFDTLTDERFPFGHPEIWRFPRKEQCSHAPGEVRCVVPAGQYFVMGDNRDRSSDSRYWGFVRPDQIHGKVVKILPMH